MERVKNMLECINLLYKLHRIMEVKSAVSGIFEFGLVQYTDQKQIDFLNQFRH